MLADQLAGQHKVGGADLLVQGGKAPTVLAQQARRGRFEGSKGINLARQQGVGHVADIHLHQGDIFF